jgi:hypothetical protein
MIYVFKEKLQFISSLGSSVDGAVRKKKGSVREG